jgi:hypothetical protein
MPIVIEPYRAEHEAAVHEFNSRLQAAGAEPDLVFFTHAEPRWLPRKQSEELYQEFFVAIENGVVRGGYALKHQNFCFADGSVRRIAYYHHPLSEGIVNKSYAALGALLLKDAMNRSPLLYCLGMGGYDRPLPKMLVRLNWAHCAVPFYFRVVRPSRFLRQMQALRGSSARRVFMDFAALSGAGWLGTRVFQAVRRLQAPNLQPFSSETFESFSEWADSLWQQCKSAYALTAVRDFCTLRLLYPASESHLMRLRVQRNGRDIGWAVAGERRKDEKFGAMRVGSIVDCWASPDDALAVVRAAVQALEDSGVDLIVSNQSHASWARALRDAGFMRAESNFIFAASKNLAALLQPFEENRLRMHFTRADGDGLPRNF